MKINRFLSASFLFIGFGLFGADHKISQEEPLRHDKMIDYFIQEYEKIKNDSLIERPYMLGTVDGRRCKLAHKGITIGSGYIVNLLGNPVGGERHGFAFTGSYGFSFKKRFDNEGLKGFEIFSSAAWRLGTNLSNKIGNQFTVSQIWGSETIRLNCLNIAQKLFDKKLIFKLGRLNAGDDFLCSPLYGQYVNNAFDGNPVAIFYNIPFTAYPGATWGAYVEGKPWEWLSAKAACYNANSKIQKNKYHGCNFTFKSTDGVVWITEWAYLNNQAKTSRGLPGNYKIGFFYLTGTKNKYLGGKQQGDPGFYILLDQTIYRPGGKDSKRGLTPFVTFFFQPQNRNLMPFFTNGGLVYRGPFEKRPDDVASFGFVYGSYSNDYSKSQVIKGKPSQSAEAVIELNYWIQLTKWFYIMPDFQYIIRPKGKSDIPNAYVFGAQIGLDNW